MAAKAIEASPNAGHLRAQHLVILRAFVQMQHCPVHSEKRSGCKHTSSGREVNRGCTTEMRYIIRIVCGFAVQFLSIEHVEVQFFVT